MNEIKPTCCWLPATATQELSKPGMSEGDKRMWTDRNGCKEVAVWRIFSDDSVYPHVGTKSCAKHLSDLCVHDGNTVYPIKTNLEYAEADGNVGSNGGSGVGAFIFIVDPSKLKVVGGTGSSTLAAPSVYDHIDNFELIPTESRSVMRLSGPTITAGLTLTHPVKVEGVSTVSEPSEPVCFCGGDCRASRYRKLSSP